MSEQPSRRPPSGRHEHHLAISTVAQQIAQVVATISMLLAITVLARRLTLSEFGTYGLLLSLSSYVLFVQASVEPAAVRAIAEANDQEARDRAFSAALTLYCAAGVVGGAVLAVAGLPFLEVLNIPHDLRAEARLGVLALAAMMALGWPFKVFQDVLRGEQLFVASAAVDTIAYPLVGAALALLALEGAPLWLLVGTGASLPLVIGVVSLLTMVVRRLPYRFDFGKVTFVYLRSFTGLSAYLLLAGVSDLVIYSLDRAILSAFRSPASVGLYEGPVRAHNLVRQLNGTLSIVVLPTSARYLSEGDAERLKALLVRGTRYTLAAVVPLTLIFMILAEPILRVWLGREFATAATAMTLLVGYWLVNANTGVAGAMLVAVGRARQLAVYAAGVAILNLVLSLSLTPSLGLNGVVLGTTISYLAMFPLFLRLVFSSLPVTLPELAREAWLPAYATGAMMAVVLLGVRAVAPLDSVVAVVVASASSALGYWALYYALWLRPNERVLIRNTALAFLRPLSGR